MNAADVMTRRVITVQTSATILEAAQLMLQHHISGLPVLDKDGMVVGMLTEGDLLRRAETGTEQSRRPRWLEFFIGPGRLAEEYSPTHGRKVAEVSKKWLRVRDTYGVDIAPGQDDILILAATVCIDQMSH